MYIKSIKLKILLMASNKINSSMLDFLVVRAFAWVKTKNLFVRPPLFHRSFDR